MSPYKHYNFTFQSPMIHDDNTWTIINHYLLKSLVVV